MRCGMSDTQRYTVVCKKEMEGAESRAECIMKPFAPAKKTSRLYHSTSSSVVKKGGEAKSMH